MNEEKPKIYNVYYYTENNRSQLARVKAYNIHDVVEFSKKEFIKPDTEIEEIADDIDFSILEFNICESCEYRDKLDEDNNQYCDFCEQVEGLTIELDQYDQTEHFKTIFGTNDFYDLTKDKPIKNKDWSPLITKGKTPQQKISGLIIQTIMDNPQLEKGFSKDLIQKSAKDVKEYLKEK